MATPIHPQRMTASMAGNFCVFLIGMRINRPLKVHKWLPVALSMPRMLRELHAHPELGFLGSETWFGRTFLVLQYWRTAEQLMAYASACDRAHLPAWRAFSRAVGNSGDVGIYHETYTVRAGGRDHLPPLPAFGLGRVGTLVPATGHYQGGQRPSRQRRPPRPRRLTRRRREPGRGGWRRG